MDLYLHCTIKTGTIIEQIAESNKGIQEKRIEISLQ